MKLYVILRSVGDGKLLENLDVRKFSSVMQSLELIIWGKFSGKIGILSCSRNLL